MPSATRASIFEPEFREDFRHWIDTERRVALRLMDIVESVVRDPFRGIGKPVPLKHMGSGIWSRRLTQEHRVIYLVRSESVHFLKARYHY